MYFFYSTADVCSMSKSRLHFLRPYCYGNAWPLSDAAGRAHLRFHHVTKRYNSLLSKEIPESWVTQDAQPRLKTLQDAGKILYPRVKTDHNSLSTEPRQFHQEYQGLQPNEHASGQNTIMAGELGLHSPIRLYADGLRKGATLSKCWIEASVCRPHTERN